MRDEFKRVFELSYIPGAVFSETLTREFMGILRSNGAPVLVLNLTKGENYGV